LRRRISGFFQEAQLRTVIGEFQDSLLEHRRTSVDRASVRAMSVNKTAWYTVIAPLILAARCAEADEDRIPPLLEAGAAYGEAFQLLDDLNEVVLDPAITGKNALDDLRTGKATLLRQILETAATPAERRILAEVYGRPDGTERELARYRNVVEVHREHITGELLALLDRARAALVAAGLDDRTVRAVEREIDPHDTFPISLDESACAMAENLTAEWAGSHVLLPPFAHCLPALERDDAERLVAESHEWCLRGLSDLLPRPELAALLAERASLWTILVLPTAPYDFLVAASRYTEYLSILDNALVDKDRLGRDPAYAARMKAAIDVLFDGVHLDGVPFDGRGAGSPADEELTIWFKPLHECLATLRAYVSDTVWKSFHHEV